MSIRILCSHCKKTYFAADKLAGKRLKCVQCGAALEVPLSTAEPESPAPQPSAPLLDGLDDLAVTTPLDDLGGDYPLSDDAAPLSATGGFSGGLASRMRGELSDILTEGGALRFITGHKLMLAVLVLAMVAFVVCLSRHRCDAAALALLVGGGIAVTAFLPQSGHLEYRLAQIIFYVGCAVSLLTAIFLFCEGRRSAFSGDSSWPMVILLAGVLLTALLGCGLSFFVCNLFPRFGMFEVLGWCYLGVVGVLPVSWSILMSLPGANEAVEQAKVAMKRVLAPNSSPDKDESPEEQPADEGEPPGEKIAAGWRKDPDGGHEATRDSTAKRPSGPQRPPDPEPMAEGPDEPQPPPWVVVADPLGRPRRELGTEPLDLGASAQDIVRVMFSGPGAARAVVLSRQSEVSRPSSPAPFAIVPPRTRKPGEEEPSEDAPAPPTEPEPQAPPDEEQMAALAASGQLTYWIAVYDLLNGRRLSRFRTSPESQLADVSLDGKEAILVTPDRLDVWSLETGKIKRNGWRLSDQNMTKVPWASFIDNLHLATFDEAARKVVVWSVPGVGLKELYSLEGIVLAGVSPGRKYLLAFTVGDEGVEGRLYKPDAYKPDSKEVEAEGCLRSSLLKEHSTTLSCAFRGDGEQIALAGSHGLVVWNMRDGKVLHEEKPREEKQRTVTKCLAFFGPRQDYLLLDNQCLFSLSHKDFVWTYQTGDTGAADPWEKVVGSPDGRVWVLVAHASPTATYLGPLDVPNDAWRSKLSDVPPGGIPVLRGQSEISIKSIPGGDKVDSEGEAYERASRDYVRKVLCDLIVGDETILQDEVWWFSEAKRPCVGLRWGLAVQKTNQAELFKPEEVKQLSGPMAIVAGVEERSNSDAFGRWPRLGDTRFRQVALLGGPQKDMLAAARRQALDVLVVTELARRPIKKVEEWEATVRIVNVANPKPPLWVSRTRRFPGGGVGPAIPAAPGPIRGGNLPAMRPPAAADPVGDFVAEILQGVKDKCRLERMTKDMARDAARQWLKKINDPASKTQDGLQLLLELRFYQSQQLITADNATPFYDKIVGEGKGRTLAEGDEPARRRVLDDWLRVSSLPDPPPPKKTISSPPDNLPKKRVSSPPDAVSKKRVK